MELSPLLSLTVAHQASDLFLIVGAPPHLKVGGVMHPVKAPALEPGQVAALPAQARARPWLR